MMIYLTERKIKTEKNYLILMVLKLHDVAHLYKRKKEKILLSHMTKASISTEN